MHSLTCTTSSSSSNRPSKTSVAIWGERKKNHTFWQFTLGYLLTFKLTSYYSSCSTTALSNSQFWLGSGGDRRWYIFYKSTAWAVVLAVRQSQVYFLDSNSLYRDFYERNSKHQCSIIFEGSFVQLHFKRILSTVIWRIAIRKQGNVNQNLRTGACSPFRKQLVSAK